MVSSVYIDTGSLHKARFDAAFDELVFYNGLAESKGNTCANPINIWGFFMKLVGGFIM